MQASVLQLVLWDHLYVLGQPLVFLFWRYQTGLLEPYH